MIPARSTPPSKMAFLGLAENDVFNWAGPLEINRQIGLSQNFLAGTFFMSSGIL
jgi:hypothetical protein